MYSGGKKSGKKAKGDARVPLVVPRTTLYIHLFFSCVLLLIDRFSPSFVSANTMTNVSPSNSSHHTGPSHNDENGCSSYTLHNIPRPSSYYPSPTFFAPRYSPTSHIQTPDHTNTYTTYTHLGYLPSTLDAPTTYNFWLTLITINFDNVLCYYSM